MLRRTPEAYDINGIVTFAVETHQGARAGRPRHDGQRLLPRFALKTSSRSLPKRAPEAGQAPDDEQRPGQPLTTLITVVKRIQRVADTPLH
jgi:hypothetical protein